MRLLAALFVSFGILAAPVFAQTGRILVSLRGDGRVRVVSPEDGTAGAAFTVGAEPGEIAVSASGQTAYVAVSGTPDGDAGGTVAVLDLAGKSVRRTFELAGFTSPGGVRLDGSGTTLFVACAPQNALLELDAETGTLEKSWKTDTEGAAFVAVTPDGGKLYVPHLAGRKLVGIDRKANNVRTILSGDPLSDVDLSPDGREAWVLDHERRSIQVIAAKSDVVVASVPLDDSAPGRLRFTPDGRRVVVVQGRRAVLIDTAERKILSALQMPLRGAALAIAPDGNHAVIANRDDDRLTIVALADPLRIVRTFAAPGKTPAGVAWLR